MLLNLDRKRTLDDVRRHVAAGVSIVDLQSGELVPQPAHTIRPSRIKLRAQRLRLNLDK
jgi:hypothetical protein